MIKAVIFDIDNTLYNFDRVHRTAMEIVESYALSALFITHEDFKFAYEKAVCDMPLRTRLDCAANHNRLLRFQYMLEILRIKDCRQAAVMAQIYWDELIDMMTPEPGIQELFARLSEKKIKIGIGTDMTAPVQYKKLEHLLLLSYVDGFVTSEEAGVEKPDPYFFSLCMEKVGCLPHECIFIGDNLTKDVKGAIRSGMCGIWYRPDGTISGEDTRYPVIRSYENCITEGGIRFPDHIVL